MNSFTDWPNNPELLVNKRVEVAWKNNRMYKGWVMGYSRETKMHSVLFEDGQEKHYNMFTKTFRIEGEARRWKPEDSKAAVRHSVPQTSRNPLHTGYGYSSGVGGTALTTSAYSTAPYMSRTPGSQTSVVFHVLLDPHCVDENDRVVINGNLPTLSGWGAGIDMVQSATNPSIWSISLNVPFSMTDSCVYGIFKHRYEIVTADGNIVEGKADRSEQTLRHQYFHIFRPNYRHSRFRGMVEPTGKSAYQQFCSELIALYTTDQISIREAFTYHRNLTACVTNARRVHAEEIFEDALEEAELSTNISALYIGLIGSFGLTSEENVYSTGQGGMGTFGTSYTYVNGIKVENPRVGAYGVPTNITKRRPPKPTVWVFHCANNLDVAALYQLHWEEEFGPNYRWVSRGVAEAIERLSEHGFYEWLKLIPLATKCNVNPHIACNIKDYGERERKFMATTDNLISLIVDQHSLITTERMRVLPLTGTTPVCADSSCGDVIGFGGKLGAENEFSVFKMETLARGWLQALIVHAPSLNIVSEIVRRGLIETTNEILQHDLLAAISLRVEEEEWSKLGFESLECMLQQMNFLCCPEIAVGLLKNSAVDNETETLVHLIDLCVREKKWKTETAPDSNESKVSHEDSHKSLGMGNLLTGLVGIWHELNCAAKEWICRKHNAEPAPEMVTVEERRDNNPYNWAFNAWGTMYSGEKRPKKLTESEKREQLRVHMELALYDINSLMHVPFFSSNPTGLLFELGRCWFMRASNVQQATLELDALCFIGSKDISRAFAIYIPPLAAFLESATLKLIRALVSLGSTYIDSLRTVTSTLNSRSALGHLLIYHLAQTMWSGEAEPTLSLPTDFQPPLNSVLEQCVFWHEISIWIENGIEDSILRSLFASVKGLIFECVNSIMNGSCTLRCMHIIIQNESAFFFLLREFGCVVSGMQGSDDLQPYVKSVHEFDNSLGQLQTYASFFCSCGIRVEAASVRSLVENLRIRYDSIQWNELQGAFDGVLAMKYVGWLYQLRGSELFLQQWRLIGRDICIDAVEGARTVLMEGENSNDTSQQDVTESVMADLAALQREEDEDEGAFAARVALVAEEMQDRVQAQFDVQDRRNDILSQVDEVELSQDVVVNKLIPEVYTAWRKLAVDTFSGALGIKELENYFIDLKTDAQILEELSLLSTCDFSGTPMDSMSSSVFLQQTLTRLKDYHFLCKLHTWLPSLIKLHQQLQSLFANSVNEDSFHITMQRALVDIQLRIKTLDLQSISGVVFSLKDVFSRYTADRLDFLSVLSSSPNLIAWLLQRSSTEEFNRLLQVVRPCTDEPRMLSAIASLVHIRTILIQTLYVYPPYESLENFLDSVSTNLDLEDPTVSGNALWHLNNIISSFEGLMEVFEKQTRSPGVKSCYDLKEILDHGTFVLKASSNHDSVLTVELAAKMTLDDPKMDDIPPGVTVESMEYLLDLRSKLLMTEIPAELEAQLNASVMVDAFVQQLQVMAELSDVLVNLCSTGHVGYQKGFELKVKFTLDSDLFLRKELMRLQRESSNWAIEVKECRTKYFYLNFYSMREILRLRSLLETVVHQEKEEMDHMCETPSPCNAPSDVPEEPPRGLPQCDTSVNNIYLIIDSMEQLGFQRDWCYASLRRTGYNLEDAIEFCFSNSQMMDRFVVEDSTQLLEGFYTGDEHCDICHDPDDTAAYNEGDIANPVDEILGLLHLISSSVDVLHALRMVQLWKDTMDDEKSLLSRLGSILSTLFDSTVQKPRKIDVPVDGTANKADMLILLNDDSEKQLPVFVACTEDPLLVIDTVLSVYIRRGRLPEPGEVIFCTPETTSEEINIILLRFILAKKYDKHESIMCIADLHSLSYTLQCFLVEKMKALFTEFGQEYASTLVIISGLPRQVALNALSSHSVDLPPLPVTQLRRSCAEAFEKHMGDTICVASRINGGGKTHFIQNDIAQRQMCGELILYKKVPLRESTTSKHLVALLSADCALRKMVSSPETAHAKLAFHIDISHIIPSAANTMLFQLLLVGVLRDSESCRVYYRNPVDIVRIELPNSPRNKTTEALRLCNLFPQQILEVNSENLSFTRPVVQKQATDMYPSPGTKISLEDYVELQHVCKWLRAVRGGKVEYGGSMYNPTYSPWTDDNITAEECFALLSAECCKQDGPAPYPSWAIFHSFILFMHMQFNALEKYPLLQGEVLCGIDGLENFKHVFVGLLIETSTDFSLRSVPQVDRVGPLPGSHFASGDEFEIALDIMPENDIAELPPPPSVVLETSREVRKGAQLSGSLNPPALVQQSSEEVARRFQNMVSWEDSDHPVVAFKMDRYQEVLGVDILSLNSRFVDRYIQGQLKRSLEENRFDFNRDWTKITNEEGVLILRQIEGLSEHHRGGVMALESGYVMTVDNMLKMLSIQLRMRFNLPVVIMGETGCGKSTLIRNMCAILGSSLHILNIHGGMQDTDIIGWMRQKIDIALRMRDPTERLVILLDEINTCNCMGLFKEIVCDRTLNGQPFPSKMKIIAACNPYRLRTTTNLYGGEEMAGLVFDNAQHFNSSKMENVGTGIKDPLRNLVYRVHPLPESLIDHIFDFGSLSSDTESLYIKAMLRKQLEMYTENSDAESRASPQERREQPLYQFYSRMSQFDEFVEVFSTLICEAQECIRQLADGERSSASLRDVARCIKVFIWFGEHLASTVGSKEQWSREEFFNIKPRAQKYVRRAVILSLSYCYHARLPRAERRILINTITNTWRSFQVTATPGAYSGLYSQGYAHYFRASCRWLNLDYSSFISILEETQREFVSVMNLGDGIALNEALCENLFMILCSILNQIPIFVIGKPGSSKSLAMGLIQANLNGDASDNEFLKSLPAVEVFSYQCSPLSTSAGIEQAFESARRYKREASNTVVVVLLDEVGLAEQSPHLPLKVLHKVLDEAGGREAVVGISNWSLDPAKMNRAVHLYRPAPTVEDLSLTAEGMVRSANLKGYLQEIARAYNEIYHKQEHPDFWGLREFYSTVRAINNSLTRKKETSCIEAVALDGEMLMRAILRNYGGRPNEMESIVKCFFRRLGLPVSESWRETTIESLVRSNLQEPEARHLMLLTKNNAALSLLLDRNILHQEDTEIIFGSDFPLDQNDLQVCVNIQRVKLCMAEGITVVLVHCESLYESLYDLLNQHYVEYGGQIYVRLAFGTYTRLCPIHRMFRVVVVVEKEEAYTKLAPPLLNRFEKQVFERSDVLRASHDTVLTRLYKFVSAFASAGSSLNSTLMKTNVSWTALRSAFCGFHSDMLSSLIIATESQYANNPLHADNEELSDEEVLFCECVRRLLWIATPEATCKLITTDGGCRLADLNREFGIDCRSEYFNYQFHSSLPGFSTAMLDQWSDKLGSQIILMTYSALTNDAASIIRDQGFAVTHVVLHELDQERELRQSVSDFFKKSVSGSTLLVQCDPLATSRRRIEHAKFMIELIRAKKIKQMEAENKFLFEKGDEHYRDGHEFKASSNDGIDQKLQPPADVCEDLDRHGYERSGESHGIHVVLLVHLPRGETSDESTYSVDFDTRWRVAFVDSISSADESGLPDAVCMIGKTIIDVFNELDVQKVLVKTFRTALSRMRCAYDRSNDDVRRQILNVTKCLRNSEFVEIIKRTIHSLLQYQFGCSKVNCITDAALNERELQLGGSFQGALHRQILGTISSLFAVALSHMDRNENLALYLEDELRDLWIYLCSQSLNESSLMLQLKTRSKNIYRAHRSTSVQNVEDIVEVKNDSFGSCGTFISQFPYSFFIIPIIDTMRKVSEGRGESQLVSQFSTLCLQCGLSDELSPVLIARYTYDLVCMKCHHVKSLDRTRQSEVVLHILNRVSGREIDISTDEFEVDIDEQSFSLNADSSIGGVTRLPQIHYRFWKYERILELYFDIMDTGVVPIDNCVAFMMNIESELDNSIHMKMMYMVLDSLDPSKFPPLSLQLWKSWFTKLAAIRPSLMSLVDLLESDSDRLLVIKTWHKYHFYQIYVRSVAIPFDLPAASINEFVSHLNNMPLTCPATLRTLLAHLGQLCLNNWDEDGGIPGDFLCPITLERMQDPVVAADGHTYERVAIQEWFARGMKTSPTTNEVLTTQNLHPNTNLRRRLITSRGQDLKRFLEYFILEVLLSPVFRKDLGHNIIEDIICIASGGTLHGLPDNVKHIKSVFPSDKSVEYILKELFKLQTTSCYDNVIEANIEKRLVELFSTCKYMDSPFSIAYVALQEDIIRGHESLADITFEHVVKINNDREISSICNALHAIALWRVHLEYLANMTTRYNDGSISGIALSTIQEVCARVRPLLEDRPDEIPVRSARLYFLKLLERQRGVSFVRNSLMVGPISHEVWLKQWKESDIGFARFLGSSRLPNLNPFVENALFKEVHGVLMDYMQTGNLSSFGLFISEFFSSHTSGEVCGALLLSCFHEISLLALLPLDSTTRVRERSVALQRWLQSDENMCSANVMHKKAIIIFGLGSLRTQMESASATINEKPYVGLTESSSTAQIFNLRLLVHVVASVIACEELEHPFGFFHSLMFQPSSLSNSYFPTMPEDDTKMAQSVLGGRWYACPNNHPFYVDRCGRPTVIQTCAACGARIGGEDHNLLSDNKDLNGVGSGYYKKTELEDKSEKNYCVRTAEEELEKSFYTTRTLTSSSVRVLRILMHSAMLAGLCLGGSSWENGAKAMLNKGYCDPTDWGTFLYDNLVSDWDMLRVYLMRSVDDVALVMHTIVTQCSHAKFVKRDCDIVPVPATPLPNGIRLPNIESCDNSRRFFTSFFKPIVRDYWEEYIDKVHIKPFTSESESGLSKKLEEIQRQFEEDKVDSAAELFVAELLEKVPYVDISIEDRCVSYPGLWRIRKPFCFEEFIVALKQMPGSQDRFPLLSMLANQDEEQLAALRHIPEVLQWFRLLHAQYNSHIDRETARNKTNSVAILEISGESPAKARCVQMAFDGFCSAWNSSWSDVRRHGCIQFSSEFNSLRMTPSVPISFSLPNEMDEGNCPLALIHFLIEKHNAFAQLVDEAYLMRARETKSRCSSQLAMEEKCARVPIISSRFLTNVHTIRCSIAEDLIPVLEKYCMLSGDGADMRHSENRGVYGGYDFAKAEGIVLDRFLADIPAVDLEMQGFTYSQEQHLQGGMAPLRQKISQEQLSPDVIRAIQRDVSTPAQAQKILEIIEQVVSFVSATGGSLVQSLSEDVGDMLLEKYMRSVLLIDEVVGSRTVLQHTALKHLESLWEVLSDITCCDAFSKVHAAYKKPISESAREDLISAFSNPSFNSSKILSVLKSFILESLQEKIMAENTPVFECLVNLEVDGVFLADAEWFVNSFPYSITIAEVVDAFDIIKESRKI